MNAPRRSAGVGRWSLQDAKNKLSAVVEAAARGVPQVVTRRGVNTAVLISYKEYQRIATRPGSYPKSLADHLLTIPSGGEDDDVIERIEVELRDDDD
jgi:prevent-host-death family protein